MELKDVADFVKQKYLAYSLAPDLAHLLSNDDYLIEDLIRFFNHELLALCGCGNPEETYEVIRKLLQIRKEFDESTISYDDVLERYKTDLGLDVTDTKHSGILQFMLYVLDNKEFLEHDEDIEHCRLTKLGKMYLLVLNAWHESVKQQEKLSTLTLF